MSTARIPRPVGRPKTVPQYVAGDQYAYIYTLSDPLDNVVCYVGSALDAKGRFTSHRHNAHTPELDGWIKGLQARKMEPLLAVIRMVPAIARFEAEREAIAHYEKLGPLFNKQMRTAFFRGSVHPTELRIWCRDHDLSEQELADLLPIDLKTLQRWETGDEPAPLLLRRALRHLGNEIRRAQAELNDPRTWFPCPHCGRMFANRGDIGHCMTSHVTGSEPYSPAVSFVPQTDEEIIEEPSEALFQTPAAEPAN